MSGTHNKLYHGNYFNHWKFSDFVIGHNYFSFSHPSINRNPTHLPKHEFPSLNNQFYQRMWYVEYSSVYAHMMWSQKFRLTPARERGLGKEVLPLQMKKLITYKSQYYPMKLGVPFFIFVCLQSVI